KALPYGVTHAVNQGLDRIEKRSRWDKKDRQIALDNLEQQSRTRWKVEGAKQWLHRKMGVDRIKKGKWSGVTIICSREFRAASQKLGDGVVKHEGWERLYGGLMPSLVSTAASQGTIISFAAFTQMTTGFIQMVLTMGIHQLNFKSEWGTNLLVSLCDTRLSCGDMLSSITDESFLWSIFTAVSLFSFPAAEASVNVFYYYTYEGSVDIDSVKDPALKASILAQINHFGQTPKQLFIKPHVKRRTNRKLPPHPLKHSTYLLSQEIRKSSSPITQIVIQNDKVMASFDTRKIYMGVIRIPFDTQAFLPPIKQSIQNSFPVKTCSEMGSLLRGMTMGRWLKDQKERKNAIILVFPLTLTDSTLLYSPPQRHSSPPSLQSLAHPFLPSQSQRPSLVVLRGTHPSLEVRLRSRRPLSSLELTRCPSSSTDNSINVGILCELVVFCGGVHKKIALGLFEPFVSHLKFVKDEISKGGYSIKLLPPNNSAFWFSKATFE
ncbi:hypothetical protein S245_044155, partial [Arachis hypogaea]